MENTETKTKGKQGRKSNPNSARQIRLAKQAQMKAEGKYKGRGRPKKEKVEVSA